MARIFISYRRSDTITITGRIHDRLTMEFGDENIFKDVDDIPLGADFRSVIDTEVGGCDVLLVMIGPDWINATFPDGHHRLEDPDDFVRVEIEAGLKRDDVLVIPVLVRGAGMPNSGDLPPSLRDLAYRNAAIVRDDPDFHRDMGRLMTQIHKHIDVAGTKEIPVVKLPTKDNVTKQVAASKTVVPPSRSKSVIESKVEMDSGVRLPIRGIGLAAVVVIIILAIALFSNPPSGQIGDGDQHPPPDGSGAVIVPADEPVMIGVALDHDDSDLNAEIVRGIEVARQDRPDLFVGERTFYWEPATEEAPCSAEGGTSLAERFMGNGQMLGVVGHTCDEGCTATAPLYTDAFFTTISPICDLPNDELAEYASFNQVSSSGLSQGAVGAAFAYLDLGVTSVVVIYDETDSGIAMGDDFANHFQEHGGEVYTMIGLDGSSASLNNAIAQVYDSGTEWVYFSGTITNAANLLFHADGLDNWGVGFILGDGTDKDLFADTVGDMGNGTYVIVPILFEGAAFANFAAVYESLHGEFPSPQAAYAYDATMMLLDAAENVGEIDESGALLIDRGAIQQYIRTYNHEGVSGYLNCDGSGSCADSGYVLYILDGENFSEYTRR